MRKYKNKENLAEVLRTARFGAGLTQAQLAKKMHTLQPSISRAENKGVATIDFSERFARACGKELRFNHISLVDDRGSYSSFTEQS